MANKKIFTGYTFEGGGQSKNLRLEAATSSPTNVGKGHAYYDTTAGTIKVSDADADATDSWKTLLTTDSSIPFSSLTGTVDADTLDGSSKSNAVGNNTIPVRDSSSLFHVGASSYYTGTDFSDFDAVSATQVANKALVAAGIAKLVSSAPAALDTLEELATALGDDAAFSTTVNTALGNRLRIDVNNQGLTSTELTNARTNLGLGALATLDTVGASEITDGSVDTAELADDAVDADKLDSSATFTMGGLTVNGTIGLNTSSPSHAFQTDVANGNANFIGIRQADQILWSTGLKASDTNLYFRSGNAGQEVDHVTFGIDGQVGIGADATNPSGTLHISTARYSTTNKVTDGSAISDTNWDANAGWSFGSGVATFTTGSGTGRVKQDSVFASADQGKRFKVTFTMSATGLVHIGNSTGNLAYVGNTDSANGTYNTYAAGTHTVWFILPVTGSYDTTTLGFWSQNASGSFSISNISVYEDTLSASTSHTALGGLSVNSAADDLVIANNDHGGLSIITPADKKGIIFFGDKNDNDRGGIKYDHAETNSVATDERMEFSVNGDNKALTLHSDLSAKFEGAVGVGVVGAVPTDAVGGLLTVKAAATGTYGIAALQSADASKKTWGAYEDGSGNGFNYIFNSSGQVKVALGSTGTSYFNGGNVAIGHTAASAKLEVVTTSNTDGIQIRRASALATATALLGFRTSSGASSTNTSSIAAVRTDLPNSGDNKLVFQTQASGSLTEHLTIDGYGTHDHKSNSIVNSATVAGLQDNGSCYDFDGANSSATNNQYIDAQFTGTFSIKGMSLWFKPNAEIVHDSANGVALIGFDDTGYSPSIYLGPTTTTLDNELITLWDGASKSAYTSSTASISAEWHHVAITYNATDSRWAIYLDGVRVDTTINGTANTSVTVERVLVGASRTGVYTDRFDGQIRDVKLFPSVLDAADIRKLYSGENPKKNLNVNLVTNGDFSSALGTTWAARRSAVVSIVSGELKVVNAGGVGSGIAEQAITLTGGKTYKLKADVKSFSGLTQAYMRVWTTSATSGGSADLDKVVTAGDDQEFVFTVSGSGSVTRYVTLQGYGGSNDDYVVFDNVSLTEVGTLVDFTPQSASSSKWRNEALLGFYDGTVNNATLSQGNSYWNNIKQDGTDVRVQGNNLFIDSDSHAELKLDAGTTSVNSGIEFQVAGVRKGIIRYDHNATDTSANLDFYTGGNTSTSAFQIQGDGNVAVTDKLGVGGTASSCQLRVAGTSEFENTIFIGDHQGSRGLISWSGDFDSGVGSAHSHLILAGSNTAANAGILFKTRTGTAHVEAGVVSAQGNWAIGGNHADEKLHVRGATDGGFTGIRIQNDDGGSSTDETVGLRFLHTSTGADGGRILSGRETNYAGANSWADANSFLAFHTATANSDAERLRIGSDGTQDHKGNRIVNSQTVSDSWRTSEPSLRFDGDGDYVDITGSFDFGGVSNFSVSVWFNANDISSSGRIFYDNRPNNANSYRVSLAVDSDSIDAYVNTSAGGAGTVVTHSTTGFVVGKWYHAVFTYNGVNQKLYLNGKEVGSTAQTGAIVDTGTGDYTGTSIGCRKDNNQDQFFNGEIKDVRIHNRALDADEVKGLYNGESTAFSDTNANTSNHLANGTFVDSFSSPNLPASWSKGGNVTITHSTESPDATGSVILEGGGSVGNTSGNWFFHNAGTAVFANNKRHRVTVTFKRKTGSDVLQVALNYYRIGQTTESAVGNSGSGTTVFYSSSDGMGGFFAGSEFVSEKLVSLGSSWFRYEVEFIAGNSVAATNQYLVLGTASDGDEFYIDNVTLQTIGEIAAYTPQSIGETGGKWSDTTSNSNHGTITGAANVSENIFGALKIKGATNKNRLQIFGTEGNANERLEIYHDGSSANIISTASGGSQYSLNQFARQFYFYTWRDSAWTNSIQIANDGAVKATSADSDDLLQVARVQHYTIEPVANNTSEVFVMNHALNTEHIIVQVHEEAAGGAVVETDIRRGKWYTSSVGNAGTGVTHGELAGSVTGNTSHNFVSVIFATAPAQASKYRVTIIS